MDFSATIDLIIKELKEAGEIIDDLKKYPGVPALQVELAKLKCKSAGEVIAMLKTLKDIPPSAEKEPLRQKKVQTQPPGEEDKPLAVQENIPVKTEVKKAKASLLERDLPHGVKETEQRKIQKKEQESSIVADKFSHLSNTFHDQLGNINPEEDIAEILQAKPISSLSEAIGVNDRFIFVREIFNGNQKDYTQAISRLESAENIMDAKAVIMSYTGDDNESEAVQQLLDLVKRKITSNE